MSRYIEPPRGDHNLLTGPWKFFTSLEVLIEEELGNWGKLAQIILGDVSPCVYH